MPSGVMDQRHVPSFRFPTEVALSFPDQRRLPTERKIGFWNQETVPDRHEDSQFLPGNFTIPSPLGKLLPIGTKPIDQTESAQEQKMTDQTSKFNLGHQMMGQDLNGGLSSNAWRAPEQEARSVGHHASLSSNSGSLFLEGRIAGLNGSCHENGLFSSSYSEIFDKKLRMAPRIGVIGRSINNKVNHNNGESEPFQFTEDIEARIIGEILPDDDDLLSAVVDARSGVRVNNGDDIDEDIFYTSGGMELEGEDGPNDGALHEVNGSKSRNGLQGANGFFNNEHPYEHPSRTLFVRNINSSVEDDELRILFEHYGDIRMLYTACKHRGFVMISYYDIRSARNAMKALQNTPLRRRNLDIHYSIPKDNPSDKDINQGELVIFNLDPSITNEDLWQIFSVFGEIKEIRENQQKCSHKFIEFYDIRAAEAALRALNKSDFVSKKIKLEQSRPGGAKHLMQPGNLERDQEEFSGCTLTGPSCSPSCFGNSFPGLSSSIPQSLSSPVGISSAGILGNHSMHSDISHSLGQLNLGFQGMGSSHPHSLPEHSSGKGNSVPYNLNTFTSAVLNGNSRGLEELNLHKLSSVPHNGHHNGFSLDSNEGAFGLSRNGTCPVHGHQHTWNNPISSTPHISAPSIWSHSPTVVNNLPSHTSQQPHGIPRPPSHVLDNVLPLQPQVGSAPSVNPIPWDRRCGAYAGDRVELRGFYPGSLGSMGFPGSPQLHQLELNSIFSHDGGSRIDAVASSSRVGVPSPQQRGPMFHGRNPVVRMPPPFDAPDRVRGRRNDFTANQADNKKQYDLDIERIIRGEDLRTTLMIKNIPNKYTSKMLLAAIDENHKGTYDFIYLPIDFKNKCNVGYAFINMTNSQHIIPFYQSFNGKKWEKFNSEKVATLAYARIQGKAALIAHFQNSSLMNEDKRCRPILFHSDGPNAGDQEPFPMGMNLRSRSGRSRNSYSEEAHQGTSATLGNGEASFSSADTCADFAKDDAPQVL